jgi:hypothetical protein
MGKASPAGPNSLNVTKGNRRREEHGRAFTSTKVLFRLCSREFVVPIGNVCAG